MTESERAGDRPRILIVDDEVRILAALRRCLRREGYAISTAETPYEALAVLEHESIDLILSDQKMPGMSGAELLLESRRLQPDAVRMLITGWSEAISPGQLEAIELAALIPKPWDDAELKESLKKALASRR